MSAGWPKLMAHDLEHHYQTLYRRTPASKYVIEI